MTTPRHITPGDGAEAANSDLAGILGGIMAQGIDATPHPLMAVHEQRIYYVLNAHPNGGRFSEKRGGFYTDGTANPFAYRSHVVTLSNGQHAYFVVIEDAGDYAKFTRNATRLAAYVANDPTLGQFIRRMARWMKGHGGFTLQTWQAAMYAAFRLESDDAISLNDGDDVECAS